MPRSLPTRPQPRASPAERERTERGLETLLAGVRKVRERATGKREEKAEESKESELEEVRR